MGMSCGGGSRGVAPFYRVGEAVEGRGGGRPVRWVLTPPVLKVSKGGGGDSMGSRLDEGRRIFRAVCGLDLARGD
jgi:hypothetical protein